MDKRRWIFKKATPHHSGFSFFGWRSFKGLPGNEGEEEGVVGLKLLTFSSGLHHPARNKIFNHFAWEEGYKEKLGPHFSSRKGVGARETSFRGRARKTSWENMHGTAAIWERKRIR